MADGIKIISDPNMLELGAQLVRAGRLAHEKTDVELWTFAERIRETAAAIAGNAGSTEIPTGLRVIPGPRSAVIETSVPIGVLWEKGNRGSSTREKTFWHPVFGNQSVRVNQARHPFLEPAARRQYPYMREQMAAIPVKGIRAAGIRVEG